MRKPVISSEISPKFGGVPTTDILPISKPHLNLQYVMSICNCASLYIVLEFNITNLPLSPINSAQYTEFSTYLLYHPLYVRSYRNCISKARSTRTFHLRSLISFSA